MKLSKITEKFITCEGCRTMYTINYPKNQDLIKVSKCSTCGKVNMTKIQQKRKRIKL
jgi:hypothetical protein